MLVTSDNKEFRLALIASDITNTLRSTKLVPLVNPSLIVCFFMYSFKLLGLVIPKELVIASMYLLYTSLMILCPFLIPCLLKALRIITPIAVEKAICKHHNVHPNPFLG